MKENIGDGDVEKDTVDDGAHGLDTGHHDHEGEVDEKAEGDDHGHEYQFNLPREGS